MIILDISSSLDLHRIENSFNLKKLKVVFGCWNIIFCRLNGLRKNKQNLNNTKLNACNLYNNFLVCNFNKLWNINNFLRKNAKSIENTIWVNKLIWKGIYLNFGWLKQRGFNNNSINNKILFYYLNKLSSIWVSILYKSLLNLLYCLRKNYIKC
jgi:hypothetical protein